MDFIRVDVRSGVVLGRTVYKRDLVKFVFSPVACTVCENASLPAKPDFWIDPE
jgi:hypothetical protein